MLRSTLTGSFWKNAVTKRVSLLCWHVESKGRQASPLYLQTLTGDWAEGTGETVSKPVTIGYYNTKLIRLPFLASWWPREHQNLPAEDNSGRIITHNL